MAHWRPICCSRHPQPARADHWRERANPAEVLGSQRMQQFVQQLRGEADILIFDTLPLLAVTDAQIVGHLADGALPVINSQKTAVGAVTACCRGWRKSTCQLWGPCSGSRRHSSVEGARRLETLPAND